MTFLWVPRVGQDCHQLFRVTPLHINVSQSHPSKPSGQWFPNWVNWIWGQFCLHLLAFLRLLPQQRALNKVPWTLLPNPSSKLISQGLPCLCLGTEASALACPAQPAMDQGLMGTTWAPPRIWSSWGEGGKVLSVPGFPVSPGLPRDLTVLESEGKRLPLGD